VGLGVLHFNTPPYGHPGVRKHLGKRGTIPPANRDPARRLTITLHSALAIFKVKRLCRRVSSLAMENTFFIDDYLLNHNQFGLYCAHMIVTWQAINTPWTPFISRSIHNLLFSSTCLAGRTFEPCENKPLTNHSEYGYPCLAVLVYTVHMQSYIFNL
jgi:hypothetical protein